MAWKSLPLIPNQTNHKFVDLHRTVQDTLYLIFPVWLKLAGQVPFRIITQVVFFLVNVAEKNQ